jgi:hypothetical protein
VRVARRYLLVAVAALALALAGPPAEFCDKVREWDYGEC